MIQYLFAIYLQIANRLNADYQKTANEESPKQSTKQYLYDFFDRISSINIFLLTSKNRLKAYKSLLASL